MDPRVSLSKVTQGHRNNTDRSDTNVPFFGPVLGRFQEYREIYAENWEFSEPTFISGPSLGGSLFIIVLTPVKTE